MGIFKLSGRNLYHLVSYKLPRSARSWLHSGTDLNHGLKSVVSDLGHKCDSSTSLPSCLCSFLWGEVFPVLLQEPWEPHLAILSQLSPVPCKGLRMLSAGITPQGHWATMTVLVASRTKPVVLPPYSIQFWGLDWGQPHARHAP